MKKILVVLVGTLLLAGCGTTETKTIVSKQDAGEVKTMATEVIEERTVELEGNLPWEFAGPDLITEWIDKGETVYLWTDTEPFETLILGTIDFTPNTGARNEDPVAMKKEAYESINDYINSFVYEMSKRYPNKQEYFDKLSEAGELLVAGDGETAKAKIEEAKSLRAE